MYFVLVIYNVLCTQSLLCFVYRIIFQKIDKDQDGLVTDTELQEWIRHVQRKYVETETDRQWTEHMASLHAGPASELRWPDYLKRTYGSAEEHAPGELLCLDIPRYGL